MGVDAARSAAVEPATEVDDVLVLHVRALRDHVRRLAAEHGERYALAWWTALSEQVILG